MQIGDEQFQEYLTSEQIQSLIVQMAEQISSDYKGRELVILGILNGSFMFLSDLVKRLDLAPEISFLKFASYEGTASSGKVHDLLGLNEDLTGKDVLIIEDIVDSGTTLAHIMQIMAGKDAASVKIATLFFKPDAYRQNIPLDYVGQEIPNLFVVGYGMDYNGKGRNLRGLYQLKR